MANAMMLMPEDVVRRVMPFINVDNNDWNATAAMVPEVGKGATAGFDTCLSRCGLSTNSASAQGPGRRMVVP